MSDPILDGITRYDDSDYEVELEPVADGIYVLFADLPALIAAVREDAEQDGRRKLMAELIGNGSDYAAGLADGNEQSQRDALDAARDAVAALIPEGYSPGFVAMAYVAGNKAALAAIDAIARGDEP